MINIGKMISDLRNERGYTQEYVARMMNCTKQTISNYEKNRRRPSYEDLEALADIFNVPIGFFINEIDKEAELTQIYKSYGIYKPKLTDEECEMLNMFRLMNDDMKQHILAIMRPMVKT